jgi:aerobic-type carbon monoxide dehydrogenase small subunit (CoxS/CutS family)
MIMTGNEAIRGLEILTYQCKHNGECGTCNICCSAIPLAIESLEEIQQYRAIGTVEEFKALKEKSVAKKPIQQETTEKTHYKCPFCNNIMQTIYRDGVGWGHIADYCEWCGQKIDMD